jgi:allantoin racemase
MTRLLVVNPNTTQAVTAAVLAEAARCARAETEIVGVTGTFGATIVSTEPENAIAAHTALDLLATHHAGFDAAIVAMSFDAGVFAARTLLPIPVVGITEAALHTACLVGRRFGLVLLGAVSLPLYNDLIDRIGLSGRLGAVEIVEVASAAAYLDRSVVDTLVEDAANRLAVKGVDVVVLCGAALAGIAARLKDRLTVPVLDGVAPALAQAEALAGLGLRPRRPSRRLAKGEPTIGLSVALAALIDGSA